VQPAAALLAARAEVNALVDVWDDAAALRLAAGNLFLDRDKARRRTEFTQLRAEVGACSDHHGGPH
jgi:hypothetical protein